MLTDGQITEVMDIFYKEMWHGVSKDPARRKQTSLQMEDTYVRTLLDGSGKLQCVFIKSSISLLTDVALLILHKMQTVMIHEQFKLVIIS